MKLDDERLKKVISLWKEVWWMIPFEAFYANIHPVSSKEIRRKLTYRYGNLRQSTLDKIEQALLSLKSEYDEQINEQFDDEDEK